MKILSYLEKAWLAAAAAALIVTVYNAVTLQTFNNRVYFPLICAMFCILLWYNVRGQRRFRDKIEEQEKQNNKQQEQPPRH